MTMKRFLAQKLDLQISKFLLNHFLNFRGLWLVILLAPNSFRSFLGILDANYKLDIF